MSPEHHRLQELLDKAAEALGEHFCSVQIIATTNNTTGTNTCAAMQASAGSLYERIGATREWVLVQDEYAKSYARANWEDEGDDT